MDEQKNKIKIAVYCRVSTEKESQKNSFENQKTYFDKKISEDENLELYKVFADEGVSGTKLSRPEFDKMLYDAGLDVKQVTNSDVPDGDIRKEYRKYVIFRNPTRQPKFNLIMTKTTSRFARNILVEDIIRELNNNGVHVRFTEDNLTTEREADLLMIKMRQIFDEEESRKRSEAVKLGHKQGKDKGIIRCNRWIYGYDFIQGETSKESHLVKNEEEAKIVECIFKLYSQGYGFRVIHRMLLEEGYRGRRGGDFGKNTLIRILRNQKYKGYNDSMKYHKDKLFSSASSKIKEIDEIGAVKSDKIPAIVSEELFDMCNKMLAEKVSHHHQKGKYYGISKYASKIYCGKCGSVFHSGVFDRRTFYRCKRKKTLGFNYCDSKNVYENAVDKHIEVVGMFLMKGMLEVTAEQIKQTIYHLIKNKLNEIDAQNSDFAKALKTEINKLKEALEKARKLYILEDNSDDVFQMITQIKEDLTLKQTEYDNVTRENIIIYDEIRNVYNLYKDAMETFPKIKDQYTYDEVMKLIDKIIINNDDVNESSFVLSCSSKIVNYLTERDNKINWINALSSYGEDFEEWEIDNIDNQLKDIL